MDLTDIHDIKAILKKYRLWAKKRFGQNFLVDKKVLEQIVTAAGLNREDIVIEIGPGLGVLTRELLPRVQKVITIEIDRDILPVLSETTHFFRDKIEIINGHVLDFQIPSGAYKIVANIPYHLTSPILRKFLVETEDRPQSMTLLVQKEVAEKICDPRRRSILSLFVEVFGSAEIVTVVPPGSFYPPPKVSSAVLNITCVSEPRIQVPTKLFFSAVKMGFAQPRKKLKNNLPAKLIESSGIDGDLRAEDLSLSDWEQVTKAIILQAKTS